MKRALRWLALSSLAACAAEGTTKTASVVVGLTTDLAVGFDIERVVVTMRVDDQVVRTEDLRYSDGRLVIPEEFWFDRVPDESRVDIQFDAYDADVLLMRQRGATTATVGHTPLLHLSLSEACIDVECGTDSTCQDGVCTPTLRESSALDEHDPGWIDDAADACRKPDDDQKLEIGKGRYAFAPLEEGETVTLEAGPQGGYHVWLALRVDGFRQLGSLVEVKGTLNTLEHEVPAFASTVTFHRAGDECEIYGLRFRVDHELLVEQLLSQPLTIEVTVTDATGAVATSARDVVLSDSVVPLP